MCVATRSTAGPRRVEESTFCRVESFAYGSPTSARDAPIRGSALGIETCRRFIQGVAEHELAHAERARRLTGGESLSQELNEFYRVDAEWMRHQLAPLDPK